MACVGPEEPDYGLIDNMAVVVNKSTSFTYLLKGHNNSFLHEYDLNFTSTGETPYSITIIVSDYSGTDSLNIELKSDENQIIYSKIITGNVLHVEHALTVSPALISFNGNNFSGLLEFVMALD